jgi:hypothetical protein
MGRPGRTLSAFAACSLATLLPTQSFAEPRAVVELFTSQGCSSCPPADKLLGELAGDRSLIALSLPIDYWDYLGWKDTLARPRHTTRQRGYAAKRGDREVYTPQVVVNGTVHAIGSDRNAIENAIARTRTQPGTLSLPIKLSVERDHVEVSLAAAEGSASGGEVWLCAIAKAIPVTIARGENKGRTVTYHNVVRRWMKLGAWSGAAQTWNLPKSELEGDNADLVAVLVQAGTLESPGPVMGAAVASLR